MTREDIEKQVLSDYRHISGKVIAVAYLRGYRENGDDLEMDFSECPIWVRVDAGASTNDLLRWMDQTFIDPCWPVTPLESRSGMEGVQGWEIYGHSYAFPTGGVCRTDYGDVSLLQRMRRALGL